ncbi:hypothetical protein [Bradyrhizobium sp. CCBAU 53415]|uniref:hypothetical protein n=1 Tax=Bradyrhizobium sp. CCBAU 53415 TaxID=1325119 RepID=UPI002304DE2D|nr:hypothetical protein [Bradyrhizobium sp. CCBAU 53415]
MTIFRLSPIDILSGDEKWSASTIQKTAWVEARDDLHARHLVEAATLKMVDAKPGRPNAVFALARSGYHVLLPR